MKHHLITASLIATLATPLPAWAEIVNVATPNTSMVLDATEDAPLKFIYYGDRVAGADLDNLVAAGARPTDCMW